MVGTGVFTTSGLLLSELHSVPAVLLAWVVGGLLAAAGALSYAELVAALPENGGEYRLLSTIYHPLVGFVAGAVSFVVGFAAPIAASALAFGEYAHRVWPEVSQLPAAIALLAVMCAVHAGRVGFTGRVQDVLTASKVVLVMALVLGALFSGDPARLTAAERPLLSVAFSPSMAVALVFVTFSYSGWNAAAYVAGEVRDPARALPRALIAGTGLVTVLYLAINVALFAAAPADTLSGEVAVGHVAATALFGESAGRVLSAVIALGLLSTVGALIMTGTRVVEAMGRDHGPLAGFARRASGGGPWVAVLAQGAVALVMVLTASFEALLGYIGVTLSLFAGLTVVGVIVLRHRQPDLPRPVLTWGYPLTPLVFAASTLWMIVWSISSRPLAALAGAGTIAAAAVGYLVSVRR